MARFQVVVTISPVGPHQGGRNNQALGVSSVGDVVVEIDAAKVVNLSNLKQAFNAAILAFSAGRELTP